MDAFELPSVSNEVPETRLIKLTREGKKGAKPPLPVACWQLVPDWPKPGRGGVVPFHSFESKQAWEGY